MIKLYSSLAPIYHEMYKQIFDYDKDFRLYHSILKKRKCHRIIEIGCGTGLLAKRLIDAGYKYTGVDLYSEMLDIARQETGSDSFIRADMRHLKLTGPFDCALITGRSIAYVIKNQDLLDTFTGINHLLKDKGILVFDMFDANRIFDHFSEESEQVVKSGDRTITRKNRLKINLTTGWTWDFDAKYIIEEGEKREEYDDHSTLRAFTKEEIRLFLKLSGFNLLEILQDNVLTVVAKKVH